jgi:hypothetical protein
MGYTLGQAASGRNVEDIDTEEHQGGPHQRHQG